MSAVGNAPVIIRRRKRAPEGPAHAGAWKIAYADFVTAMMAFFLIMWLLNATTERQRKGIADYFSPTVPLSPVSGGGDGFFGGDSVFTADEMAASGIGATDRAATEAEHARGKSGLDADGAGQADGVAGGPDDTAYRKVVEALAGNSGESMISDRARRHIVTRVTDEGLIVELFDLPGEALFLEDTATPTPLLEELAGVMARVFKGVENRVAVNGHVRSYPVVLSHDPVWPLSSERAAHMRQLVVAAGLDDGRFQRTTGTADRDPAAANPAAIRNNRVEVILLRSGHG